MRGFPRRAVPIGLALTLAVAPASAAPRAVLPEGLKLSAALCLGEALRLCPDLLADAARGASCLMGRRRLLGRTCRGLVGGATVPKRSGGRS